MRFVDLEDQRLGWDGAVGVQHTPQWSQAWRLPPEERGLFHPMLASRAAIAAGVRLRFRSDTLNLHLAFEKALDDVTPLDIRCNNQLVATIPIRGKEQADLKDLPAGEKELEIWLPHFGEFRLRRLGIDDNASFEHHLDLRDKWITYGSSITHCRHADSPTQTWPAIVALRCGWNLTCLGYGGQCHLDPLMACLIRDLDADYISLKIGANIHAGTLNERTFMSNLIGFVRIIRERHVNTPMALISPIYSGPREETEGPSGLSYRTIRRDTRQAVEILQAHGDTQIQYIDGRSLLGAELAHLMPDDLHPNNEGYARMADHFIAHVARPIFGAHVE